MQSHQKPKVVVLGGGFGGLEFAFSLRRSLEDHVDLTVVSDQDHFLFKPNTIYVPFGLDFRKLQLPLAPALRSKRIGFIQGRVRETDPVQKVIYTENHKLNYDFLAIATGAGMRAAEVPGLQEYAHTIWTPENMIGLGEAFFHLSNDARHGRERVVLFLVPPNNKCAGPLYEIVLMLDTWLRRNGTRDRVSITWSTYEESYVQAFGPRLDEVVSCEFDRRGIAGYRGYAVKNVEEKRVIYRNGRELAFDLLVSFPPYVASPPFPGLPADERGFIHVDAATRQVAGHPEVYAVGDAGDFPVKQAFLAFLQADAAAEHLASRILEKKFTVPFDPVSMCVMEQLDQATFAQVPLRLTGRPEKPVEVRPEANGSYRVGTSPLWRLGKKLLGVYLPWRFKAGNPFHAGLPWRGMEIGLKVMSSLLAR